MVIFDIIIIGSGPAGYRAAEKSAKNGLSVVLFEKNEIGGVCLNEGCIPTKTLLHSAKMYHNILQSEKYGISVEFSKFNIKNVIIRKNKILKKLSLGILNRLKNNGVKIIKREAKIIEINNEIFKISDGVETYLSKNLIIATGSSNIIPNIEGIKNCEYKTNREVLNMEELPKSVTIIGAGVIGIEFASLFSSLGIKVYVFEILSDILGGFDNDITSILKEQLSKNGVEFLLNTKVVEIETKKVRYLKDDKEQILECENIILSIGRKSSLSIEGIEKLNICIDRDHIKTDQQCRTNIKNLYAIGDVNGQSMLAHTAYREADVAINTILGIEDIVNYNNVPNVVYSNPEVAWIGKTEKQCKEQNIEFKIIKAPMSFSGRFVIENEMFNGLCKIVIENKTEKIIGIQLIGNQSSEIISTAVHIITENLKIKDLERYIYPHPTVTEIFKQDIF